MISWSNRLSFTGSSIMLGLWRIVGGRDWPIQEWSLSTSVTLAQVRDTDHLFKMGT